MPKELIRCLTQPCSFCGARLCAKAPTEAHAYVKSPAVVRECCGLVDGAYFTNSGRQERMSSGDATRPKQFGGLVRCASLICLLLAMHEPVFQTAQRSNTNSRGCKPTLGVQGMCDPCGVKCVWLGTVGCCPRLFMFCPSGQSGAVRGCALAICLANLA